MAWEGLNRRKFPRAMFPCLIKIRQKGESTEAILTHTENVSIGGVCVIVRKHLELFTPVALEIDFMDGEELVMCNARVVWAVRRKATEEQKPSFYDIGVEFVDIKDDDRTRIEKMVSRIVAVHNHQRAE